MSITLIKRKNDNSNDGDLTILMTLTSTYTITSATSPAKSKKLSTSTSMLGDSIISSTSSRRSMVNMLYEGSTTLRTSTTFRPSSSKTSATSSTYDSSTLQSSDSSPVTFHNELSGVINSSGSNNSLKLGLAIGIPISIVSLFIIIVLSFVYFKKKTFNKRKDRIISYKDEFFNLSKHESLTKYEKPNFETSITRSITSSSIPERQGSTDDETIIKLNRGPNKAINRQSIKLFFKDRLSRVINIRDINESENESEYVRSPTFLKKFNLSKPQSPKFSGPSEVYSTNKSFKHNSFTSRIEPQFLSYPYSQSNLSMNKIREKMKDLPKLPSIINTYQSSSLSKMENVVSSDKTLDPVRGGGFNLKDKLYMVIKSYKKILTDELNISIGDTVCILTEHSDGWCKVKIIREGQDYYLNINNNNEGMVPKLCLKKINN